MPVFFYTFDTGLLNFVPGEGQAVAPANGLTGATACPTPLDAQGLHLPAAG